MPLLQSVSLSLAVFPTTFHSSVSLIWKLVVYNFWESANSCHNHKELCLGSCATCLFLSCSEAPGALWHWWSVVHPLTPSFSLQTRSHSPIMAGSSSFCYDQHEHLISSWPLHLLSRLRKIHLMSGTWQIFLGTLKHSCERKARLRCVCLCKPAKGSINSI